VFTAALSSTATPTPSPQSGLGPDPLSLSPVRAVRTAFLAQCKYMQGTGEFVNACWAWVQVRSHCPYCTYCPCCTYFPCCNYCPCCTYCPCCLLTVRAVLTVRAGDEDKVGGAGGGGAGRAGEVCGEGGGTVQREGCSHTAR
jgi:hypothetical protein